LAQTLNKILLNHIHTSLPELRSKITTLLADSEKELSSYGDPFLDQSANKVRIFLGF
jgi:dynamin 1-like protein